MVKLPIEGNVKTRLGREIGAVQATFFYRHAARAQIARLAATRQWETTLAVSPDDAVASNVWPFGVTRMSQGRGELGARMQRPMDCLPPGPVIVIGSDIPGVRPRHIAEAFSLLGSRDAVLGPAEDGGFWLIGFRRRPHIPRRLQGIPWSAADTMDHTVAAMRGLTIGYAAVLNDVDDAADHHRSSGWSGRLVPPCGAQR